ncbi:hypothetical protein IU412_06785 [Nocardia cyriacigeorgica]|nr:hypothetical protein [Nocardia cyriacigeorgica]
MVAEFAALSPEFARALAEHDVRVRGRGRERLNHPEADRGRFRGADVAAGDRSAAGHLPGRRRRVTAGPRSPGRPRPRPRTQRLRTTVGPPHGQRAEGAGPVSAQSTAVSSAGSSSSDSS